MMLHIRRRSVRAENLLRLDNTVGEREFETRSKELLDILTLYVVGLLQLDNLENLYSKLMSIPDISTPSNNVHECS
jgi:hypothetical protein